MNHRSIAAALLLGIAPVAAALAQNTAPGRNLASACANCHGTDGRALEGFPALSGMEPARFTQTMSEFKTGTRAATVMHQIAKGYTDQQIRRLAEYFSQQTAK